MSAHQQMLSSGAGALVVSLFMTPLDVVKIRLQAQVPSHFHILKLFGAEVVFTTDKLYCTELQERLHAKKCFLYSNGLMDHLCPRTNGDPPARALHTAQEICDCKWFNRPRYFSGTADAFLKIGRTEGLASLWSGLAPTLILAVPATVTYFTLYEQLKVVLMDDQLNQFTKSS